MSIERFGTTRRYSDIVAHANTVYLVEVPQTLDADIATQTREVLASVEQLLKKAGSDKSRLLQVTLYLRDLGRLLFSPSTFPVRRRNDLVTTFWVL